MSGPDHYREAERLVSYADQMAGRATVGQQQAALTAAQVHATAAAQATAYDGDEDGSRSRGWAGVA